MPHREGHEADRLQKVLAHAGVSSRRACEEFILQGRVTVNGQIVRELGTKVVAGRDKVAVDGQAIHDERPAYIAVNKPKGYVSTNADPSGRPRVVDLVPDIPQRVYTVGRLDEMSTGLLLLTNDGELANRLAHPKFGVEKVYRAVVAGAPSNEVLQKLTEGVWLAEGKVRAKRVKSIARKGDATVLEMVLAEGKNREVRRMLAKFGHKVMTLTRVAIGPVTLMGLKPGGWRFLTAREVDLLRRVADGLPVPMGRFGNDRDRPLRPPTRGPRAVGRQDESRADGPPQRERFARDDERAPGQRPPSGGPPRQAQGGPPRHAQAGGPPRHAQAGGPPRPPYSAGRPGDSQGRRPMPPGPQAGRPYENQGRRPMPSGPPQAGRPGVPKGVVPCRRGPPRGRSSNVPAIIRPDLPRDRPAPRGLRGRSSA